MKKPEQIFVSVFCLFRFALNNYLCAANSPELKNGTSNKMFCFPKNTFGKILGYENETLKMPAKVMEMGLLPETVFRILYQAPFSGPLYVEFGEEKSRIALRQEEAEFILVETLT